MADLAVAVKANLPLVTIKTHDILNVERVLCHVLATKVALYPVNADLEPSKATVAKNKLASFDVFYTLNPDIKCTEAMYNWFVENEKTLILVNYAGAADYTYDGGILHAPSALIAKLLADAIDEKTIVAVLPLLQGLTIKEVTELIRITIAADGHISQKTITAHRGAVISSVQGFSPVDTSMTVYMPNKELQGYLDLNKEYFINTKAPAQLIPRGLLLEGLPGVGKSMAAKHIATTFGVPLYRMDLSASLSRYVGSSEQNLQKILEAVQNEAPCVFLLDEVEKLFGESDDSGVTYRLLAQLLWFLQEHKTRIFTIMTTNNKSKLPPELYRSGRIDKCLLMNPLEIGEALELAKTVVKQFVTITKAMEKEITDAIYSLQTEVTNLTPAAITNTMYTLIKKNKWIPLDKTK